MERLVDYMVRSVVSHSDAVSLTVTEGEASVLFELDVHDDDRSLLTSGDQPLLDAMRQILSASDDSRRGVLELVSGASEE